MATKEILEFSGNENYQKLVKSIKSLDYSKPVQAVHDLSSIHRFVHVPEIGYSVVCFRATKIVENDQDQPTKPNETKSSHIHIETIYAFVYVDISSDDKNVYIEPKYVCCSPTYTSRDGEYRQRYIPFDQIMHAKGTFPELWADAEKWTLDKMVETYEAVDLYDKYTIPIKGGVETSAIVSGDILFHADLYLADGYQEYEDYMIKWVNQSRMAIHLFIAAWLPDGANIFRGIEENHINTNYRIVMYDIDDKDFFAEWTSDNDKRLQLNKCNYILGYIQTQKSVATNAIKIGQKIIPLTIQEVMTHDCALGVWKEIILSYLCGNLVVNGIAPGFALFGGWYFLQNIDMGLFDNDAMHELYNFSNEIMNLNGLLTKARDLVWREGNAGTADLDSIAKQINDVMKFSYSYVTMTNVAIVLLTEWIGNTIRDIPRIHRNYRLNKNVVPWVVTHAFDTPHVFIKYIFDYVYNIHAANIHLKILHGDLHLNNMTISKYIDLVTRVDGLEEYKVGKNPMSMYIVPTADKKGDISLPGAFDPAKDMFLFESYGFCGSIIDYSRAIVGDLKLLRTIDPNSLPDEEFVQRRQREMAFRLFHKIIPDTVEKYEDRIKYLIYEKFTLMHKILMIADYYMMSDSIHLLLEAEFPNNMKKMRSAKDYMRIWPSPEEVELTPEQEGVLAPEIPILLAGIRDYSRELLITTLMRAINDDVSFADELEWPGQLIIRRFFGEYTFAGRGQKIEEYDENNIYEYFNLANPIKYSSADKSKFGQKPEDLQTTMKNPDNIALHTKKIKEYLEFLKTGPATEAKMQIMKNKFKQINNLPTSSVYKYEKL